MRKLRSLTIGLLTCTAMPGFTQDIVFEEIIRRGSVDLFVTETTIPEEWLVKEAANPNPRPVSGQRFINLGDALDSTTFNSTVKTPFEFRMFFMDGVEHRVVIESIEEVSRGPTELRRVRGRIKSDDLSRISFVLTDEQIRGTVHFDDSVIELRPVVDNISVIQVLNPFRFPKERRPVPAHRQAGFVKKEPPDFSLMVSAGDDFTGIEPYDEGPYGDTAYEAPEIGVLVIQHAENSNCDVDPLNSAAESYQESLDGAFASYATSRVELLCTTRAEEWTSLEAARSYIMNDTTVQGWRQSADADLVILLVEDGMGSCGFAMYPHYPAYPIDDYVDQYALNAAFAVVDKDCALGQFSLAHEVGHLFGMKHERFNEQGGVNSFCGYGYPVMQGHKPVDVTIMSYDDYCSFVGESCAREPYYSVPRKKSTGLFGWFANMWHKCFGKIKGITCESTTPGHLNRPANNTMQLVDAAQFVATYSDEL